MKKFQILFIFGLCTIFLTHSVNAGAIQTALCKFGCGKETCKVSEMKKACQQVCGEGDKSIQNCEAAKDEPLAKRPELRGKIQSACDISVPFVGKVSEKISQMKSVCDQAAQEPAAAEEPAAEEQAPAQEKAPEKPEAVEAEKPAAPEKPEAVEKEAEKPAGEVAGAVAGAVAGLVADPMCSLGCNATTCRVRDIKKVCTDTCDLEAIAECKGTAAVAGKAEASEAGAAFCKVGCNGVSCKKTSIQKLCSKICEDKEAIANCLAAEAS